jgi:hypothetical protein
MTHAVRGLGLAATLVLVFTVAVVPQARAQSTSSTAAYVYIQIDGPQGAVYGFSASSTGKLSAIPGAPWKPTGQIVGSNKSQFITLGEDNIHSYGISANGAIEGQLEQNPYTDYAGGECGTGSTALNSAVLDHTGKYVYILLQSSNGITGCSSYQSFNINSAGAFDGVGDAVLSGAVDTTLPSILGAETFAYADDSFGPIGFQRESSGALEQLQFHETDPTLNGGFYTPGFPDASPTGNYVVLHLFPNGANPFQLGSYTVSSEGNLTTTNTSSNMPTSGLIGASSTFSPSGNMFVLYADSGGNDEGQEVPGGIEIYNFNGAAPLTLYTKLLTGTSIDQVAWDSSNHLYAISKSENKLYVFTVTPTSVTQDTAWSIGSPFKMVVVSESTGGGVTPTTQFEAPLLTSTLAVDGHVTIDTSGNTTVQVTGQAANKTYTLQFCPASSDSGDNNTPPCPNITTFSTDGSGSGSSTVKFPQSGTWAGEFSVNDSSGNPVIQTGLYSGVNDETYLSTLVPETTTNGGLLAVNDSVQDPLSSGSVSYSNGTVVFTLKGASPNTTYDTVETNGRFLYSSQTYNLGVYIFTDALGNGSSSANLATANSEGGDMFNVEGGTGTGFIGGFSVP